MTSIVNLKKLLKLKVLQLVDPSENLKISYLEKSFDSLKSAKILKENSLYSDSIPLSYYSMYNSLLALLFKIGIKSENHNVSIFLLKKIFRLDNSDIIHSKKSRTQAQYYTSSDSSEQSTQYAVESAENFNYKIRDFIDRLTSDQIEEYRNKFKELLEI
mgnify:CR=1 FL=1|jgi:uncharacterized protein (UPF0332 family)